MMDAVVVLASTPGLTKGACAALNLSRASVYRERWHLVRPTVVPRPRPKPCRALDAAERQTVLDLLHGQRFADQAPAEIYACLLDEGVYHCSIRTMYRILAASQEVRERRQQLRHPVYKKPELLAQAPNEVWSWDITKLMGPAKWSYFYLYVIITVGAWSAGVSPIARAQPCSRRCSRTPPPNIRRRKASLLYMPIAAARCVPRPPHCCSLISVSPNPTAGRTPPTTILSRKATSKP